MSEIDRRLKRLEDRVSDKTGSIARFSQWLIALSRAEGEAYNYASRIRGEFLEGRRSALPKNDLLFTRGMALRAQAPELDDEELSRAAEAGLVPVPNETIESWLRQNPRKLEARLGELDKAEQQARNQAAWRA